MRRNNEEQLSVNAIADKIFQECLKEVVAERKHWDADEYIHSCGWDINAVLATAVNGVSREHAMELTPKQAKALIAECRRRIIGQRVECGASGGYDTGRIDGIDGDMVVISWDSGVVTMSPLSGLVAI